MTFRTRIILAATAAAIFAALVAAIGAYVSSSNSLASSVDSTLRNAAAKAPTSGTTHALQRALETAGVTVQIVLKDGTPIVYGHLPVTNATTAVADGASPFFTDVTVKGTQLREYDSEIKIQLLQPPPFPPIIENATLQLATPLTGVNSQLGTLTWALVIIAVTSVVLAVILGWVIARAALRPLNNLITSVEELADTTDVSRRLDARGVDELGRLRRAFNRLLEALERSRESQRQLVLDAAHELRTPLTSLRTNLEVVRRVEELPPTDRAVLVSDVLTQMEELTQLVGDLAELTRGDHAVSEPSHFRLDELVEDAVELAASHGRPRGVQFESSLEESWVHAHRDRVMRAVGNLLDNALKWSPDGGLVEVTSARGKVTVRDHGPGIKPEDLPHVFDRFYRAPSARGLPGSGLGLAIVAQVAHDEGGSVQVTNAPDGGTLFELQLPTVPAPAGIAADD